VSKYHEWPALVALFDAGSARAASLQMMPI
jgi:hypothetical protein